MLFYRDYPYAPRATLISIFSNLFGYVSAIFAICLITQVIKNPVMAIPAILLGALAAFLIIYVGRTVCDKVAEKDTEHNIKTKPRFAMLYCKSHPSEYDRIAQINPAFADKYMKDESGKIVKRT